jgi:PhzF family phenazine biosynthesis protein
MAERMRPYAEVDVFAGAPLRGNPVAVVLDAEGLDEARMQAFARWTNLSETTFVLPPTAPGADYALRIFTPAEELPFAGHPTLGTAAAWADHTGSAADRLVQECAVGLVPLRRTGDRLAFAAPPLRRSGPASDEERATAARALRLPAEQVLAAEWVDNGPGWLAARLPDAATVLAVRPDLDAMPFPLGVVGPHPEGGPADFEVRAFVPGLGVPEDPVTGSLNAGLAVWFLREGVTAAPYTVRQGTAVGAAGLVTVEQDDEGIWIAGDCESRVRGEVLL